MDKIQVELSGHVLSIVVTEYGSAYFKVRRGDADQGEGVDQTYVYASQARELAEAFSALAEELENPTVRISTGEMNKQDFETLVVAAIKSAKAKGRLV